MKKVELKNGQWVMAQTTEGTVKGYVTGGVCAFKGIPYAQAERFHAPVPPKPRNEIFDATNYGYVCPLLEIEKPQGELKVPHRYWPVSEHCQNLNIWTPFCEDAKRPVMVWLHGGGFEAGSAIEQVAYEGVNLCRHGQVVVVSVNHRLNLLGFLDLSAFGEEYSRSANAGMDDIIAALKWIQKNIRHFGGDPDQVTLFGQSGGGAKITALLQMPEADGLFGKAICMSGVMEKCMDDSEGDGEELIRRMMQELEIKEPKKLETIPYETLTEVYKKVRPAFQKAGKYDGGSPKPNTFYRGNPLKYGFRKESANIPMLIGTVYGEFSGFTGSLNREAYPEREMQIKAVEERLGMEAAEKIVPLFEKAYPDRPVSDLLYLDYTFRYPTQEYIRLRSALNERTYAYLFDHDFEIDEKTAPWHCSDIPFVFHNLELVEYAHSPKDHALEQKIFDAVMAFVRTGDPNCESVPEWNPSTPQEEHTLLLRSEPQERINHDRELIPVFRSFMTPLYEKMWKDEQGKFQH